MKDRRVKDMTAATQRFRRRVIAALRSRTRGIDAMNEKTPEAYHHLRATYSIIEQIEAMR